MDTTLSQLSLAADARFSRVDYTDDQVWNIVPGRLDSPALAFQTRYGGRVGLASLVPMWTLLNDRRTIYQAQAYAQPPKFTAFAPGFARLEAALLPGLALTVEALVLESHAAGTRYTLTNTDTQAVSLRLDLFAQVAAEGRTLKLAVVTLAGGLNALSFGEINDIYPAVILENATAQLTPGKATSPKIGVDLNIPAGGSVRVRWVHAGSHDLRNSLALAESWLAQDWDAHIKRTEQSAAAIPVIQTGSADLDRAVAVSYHQLLQSIMKGGSLPHPSLVATRQPASGFSPNGEGSDHDRAWSGQPSPLAYLAAPALATVDAELAKGIVRNFLAVQEANGAIDGKPGLAGQRQGSLAVPILARLTLELYEITQDEAFVREALPGLIRFYRHWFTQDADGDGLPEWLNERQSGYVYFPTFGTNQAWAQNADIRYVESPDLAAYLVSEAESLLKLGEIISEANISREVEPRAVSQLAELWNNGRYIYRDRDTHIVGQPGVMLLEDARADEALVLAATLEREARLLIRITGGTGKPPRVTLHIHGTGMTGAPVHETGSLKEVGWYRGYGVYVTQNVFTFVDRVVVEGLSRVYRVDVGTVDLSRMDITAVLPLWVKGLSTEHAAALVSHITNPDVFALPNGIPMTPASDPAFNPAENGGIWLFWLSLVGEGLLSHGFIKEAGDLLRRVMRAQAAVLQQDGQFHEFYHSEEAKGSGESGSLAGIVPLHLLHKALGVFIVSPSRVMVGGSFAWDAPVTVQQHGVTVTRSQAGSKIIFPSGYTVELPADAPMQRVDDPQAAATAAPIHVETPEYPTSAAQPNPGRVLIRVQIEPDVAKSRPESNESA